MRNKYFYIIIIILSSFGLKAQLHHEFILTGGNHKFYYVSKNFKYTQYFETFGSFKAGTNLKYELPYNISISSGIHYKQNHIRQVQTIGGIKEKQAFTTRFIGLPLNLHLGFGDYKTELYGGYTINYNLSRIRIKPRSIRNYRYHSSVQLGFSQQITKKIILMIEIEDDLNPLGYSDIVIGNSTPILYEKENSYYSITFRAGIKYKITFLNK
jgi:hypothetical protein